MAITCHYNGSLCTKFFSDSSNGSSTVFGFIIGTIACLIVIIVIVLILYIVCCKRYMRNKPRAPIQSHNQEQPIGIDRSQEEPELTSRISLEEQPPSYQEINITANGTVYKNT